MFDFEKYKEKYVMHCKTEEESKEFCGEMDKAKKTWWNRDPYSKTTNWDCRKESTCYNFNDGFACYDDYYKQDGYTILEWSDFRKEKEMTKKDLKTGMVVELRDGGKGIVLLNTPCGDVLIGEGWHILLEDYKETLNCSDSLFDVMKVYKPNYVYRMEKDCWDEQELIWTRTEPKELTFKEIADKFGIAVEDLRIKEE